MFVWIIIIIESFILWSHQSSNVTVVNRMLNRTWGWNTPTNVIRLLFFHQMRWNLNSSSMLMKGMTYITSFVSAFCFLSIFEKNMQIRLILKKKSFFYETAQPNLTNPFSNVPCMVLFQDYVWLPLHSPTMAAVNKNRNFFKLLKCYILS